MIVFQKRRCSNCDRILIATTEFFNVGDEKNCFGLYGQCKECKKNKKKERYDPIKQAEKWSLYYNKNKEKESKRKKQSYKENKEIMFVRHSEWAKKRRKNNTLFKLKENISACIRSSVNKKFFNKNTKEILGCSFEFFKEYIEGLFSKGMNWTNHGKLKKGKWQLHHLMPLHTAEDEEELILLNHYTNFYPLWTEDHLETHKHLNRCGL